MIMVMRLDEPDWGMESLEHIPLTRRSRLEAHFEKIDYVHCKACDIDIEKQGKYCILCTGSTIDSDTRTIYVEKRGYQK